MNSGGCTAPVTFGQLAEYWLDDLAPDRQHEIEEHLLGCGACSSRLSAMVNLADGVKAIVRAGGVGLVMTTAFVRRLQQAGARVREYQLQPGGSVFCTVAPEDDLVVAHLAASLSGIGRLDVLVHDTEVGHTLRLEDIPFDTAAGEVVLAPNLRELRQRGVSTQRMQLVAVAESGETVLGDYTFNHSPYRR
jgi:hypothetical protein